MPPPTLDAVVVHNGIHHLERYFVSNERANYTFVYTGRDFPVRLAKALESADLLVVPNGSDHVAMLAAREVVRVFLDRGRSLACFDGWFTDWVPGNKWTMDNSKPTIEVRYRVRTDRHQLFEGVEIDELIFNNGISGWWGCGFITPAPNADVVIEDTWGRAMMVLDEGSTPGTIILTSSGPLGDSATNSTGGALATLYGNVIGYIARRGSALGTSNSTTATKEQHAADCPAL